MTELPNHRWAQFNQSLLAEEFAYLRALLAPKDGEVKVTAIKETSETRPLPAAIDTLSTLFSLSDFERYLVLLCAGVELDNDLLMAVNKLGASYVSFGLAINVLPNPHWNALAPQEPLRRWRLIYLVEPVESLNQARLTLDERVLHFIAGYNYMDHRLQGFVKVVPACGLLAKPHQLILDQIKQQSWINGGTAEACVLYGDDSTAQRDVAASFAESVGCQLCTLDASKLPVEAQALNALASIWYREQILTKYFLCIEHVDDNTAVSVTEFLAQLNSCVFITAREPTLINGSQISFKINKSDALEQKALWLQALGSNATVLQEAVNKASNHYKLSASDIERLSAEFRDSSATTDTQNYSLKLMKKLRYAHSRNVSSLVQVIEPRLGWSELHLPDMQMQILSSIVSQVRNREKVYREWGFAKAAHLDSGVSALFCGYSGTGKTMAAEVIANDLSLMLWRLDLASVMSKYIGDTEKNLSKIFDAAESAGVVLVVDEADALFGKRSEVNDSRDRYANIGVSYLLQRMECFSGLVILTSNNKSAIDSAFHRRIRFCVSFSLPDAQLRQSIWQSAFPTDAPVRNLDFTKLARLELTGGSIRNIALNAAFQAAELDTDISMELLRNAAQLDAVKTGRALPKSEVGDWL